MDRKSAILARGLVVIVLAGLCLSTAFAQNDGTVKKIAVVSLSRIQSQYERLHAQERDLGAWLESRKQYHDQLTNFVFLPKKEFEEAIELTRKDQPLSEEDQKRLDELRRISGNNEERYAELRAKPNRTAEETAEFNALQDMYDASQETLKALQKSIMNQLSERRDTALAGLMDTVEQAVIDTAREGGYDMVLDSDMVFYGGDDITDAVVERLNGTGDDEGGQQSGEADEPEAQGEDGGGQETGE